MGTQIPVVRVNRTGALIRLHDNNRNLLTRPGMTETVAEQDEKTGRLVEVNGADFTSTVVASQSLARIGSAIQANIKQRETLLTAALKMPGAAEYLETIGVYDGKDDKQYIDPNTLQANNSGLPEVGVSVLSQDELRAMKSESTEPEEKSAKPTVSKSTTRRKKAQQKSEPDADALADL